LGPEQVVKGPWAFKKIKFEVWERWIPIRAVPEIIPGGWAATVFCPEGGCIITLSLS